MKSFLGTTALILIPFSVSAMLIIWDNTEKQPTLEKQKLSAIEDVTRYFLKRKIKPSLLVMLIGFIYLIIAITGMASFPPGQTIFQV